MSANNVELPIRLGSSGSIQITTGFGVPYTLSSGAIEFAGVRTAIKTALAQWKSIGKTGNYNTDFSNFLKRNGFVRTRSLFIPITLHTGLDFNVVPTSIEGELPVRAVANGTVIHARFVNRNNYAAIVTIQHQYKNIKFYSNNWHLGRNLLVRVGQQVEKGTPIGYMADETDYAVVNPSTKSGRHLHFEIRLENFDPLTWGIFDTLGADTNLFDAVKFVWDRLPALDWGQKITVTRADINKYTLPSGAIFSSVGINLNNYLTISNQFISSQPASFGNRVLNTRYADPIEFLKKIACPKNSLDTTRISYGPALTTVDI